MSVLVRRLSTVVGGATAVVLVAAGPAAAHFCFLVNASDRSDAGRAGSNGWNTFAEDARSFFPDLCDDGIAVLAEAAGVSPDTPILAHSVLANGTLRNGQGKDVPAVDYLDIEALEAVIPDALAACAAP